MRLFGLETEYGIAREDLDALDPVVESMALVRAHLTSTFERTWDYGAEDPHEDARGFRATHLQQDREDIDRHELRPTTKDFASQSPVIGDDEAFGSQLGKVLQVQMGCDDPVRPVFSLAARKFDVEIVGDPIDAG